MTVIPAIEPLKAWIVRSGMTPHAFARRAGLDPSEFHKLLAGKRGAVSIEYAAKVEDATDGAITIRMFIPVRVEEESHETHGS